jgi:hypothetical protein
MSNDINLVISLLQRLDTKRALDALARLSDYPGIDSNYLILENFIEGVHIIQGKTIRPIPSLCKKDS